MPTPPIPEEVTAHKPITPPVPRNASPRPKPNNKRSKKTVDQTPQASGSVRDGAVPPINVLIVEDNIINLRLLEAFMKRLKVRWSTAMNGKDAVTKWREGGFHLVLMDIQLPVMNGLDATKEIRRLERVNNIGVFSNSASTTPTFPNGNTVDGMPDRVDSLMNTALFKSPVIIVALTASSLQSDRHEALAAGCNDFLTKVYNSQLSLHTTPSYTANSSLTARQFRMANPQSHGMGLHASPHRLRRLAQMERFQPGHTRPRGQREEDRRQRRREERCV